MWSVNILGMHLVLLTYWDLFYGPGNVLSLWSYYIGLKKYIYSKGLITLYYKCHLDKDVDYTVQIFCIFVYFSCIYFYTVTNFE